MKRRTLDIMFSIGGVALAGLLVIAGLVFASNANFANKYVEEQLSDQGITFRAADQLSEAEIAFTEARSGCVIAYAGQQLTTGKHAECYANEYIAGHLKDPMRNPPAEGRTFAALGAVRTALVAEIAEAEATNHPRLPQLKEDLAALTAARATVFQGETLRGTLLTTYGFSVLGDKASQAANVAFIAAILLVALAIAGFLHAFRTPPTRMIAHEELARHEADRRLEHV